MLCSWWHQILLILLIPLLFFVWYVSLVMSKEEEIIVVALSWLFKSSVHLNKSVTGNKKGLWILIIQQWIKNVDSALMQRGKWCASGIACKQSRQFDESVSSPTLIKYTRASLHLVCQSTESVFHLSLSLSSPNPHLSFIQVSSLGWNSSLADWTWWYPDNEKWDRYMSWALVPFSHLHRP